MGKRSKKSAPSKKTLEKLRVIIFSICLVVVFYPPFLRGLYFEAEQFPTEIIIFTAFILFWVCKLIKKDKIFLETPIDYAAFGFVIVYFISLFAAVSLRSATSEWLKYCMYFAVFLMLTELADTYKKKTMVLWIIIASAAGVSILGIDGAAGGSIASTLNKFLKLFGIKQDIIFDTFKGGRIFSTLQYPNALAAYLMAVFSTCLGLVITSQKLWTKMLAAAAGFITLTTFIFTLSRGAYVIMPLISVIFLVALPKGSRVKGVAYSLAVIIPAATASIILSGHMAGTAESVSRIWSTVVLGIILTGTLALVMKFVIKFLERLSWKVYARLISALVIILLAGAIYALNSYMPLELVYSQKPIPGQSTIKKSVVLKPGTEYKLKFDVDASAGGNTGEVYSIDIANKTKIDVLQERETTFAVYNGKKTNGTERGEFSFKIPNESSIVNIYFSNIGEGTKVIFDNARIEEADSGETVKNLRLRYKYLPYSIASRFEDIKATKSSIERGIFYRDGLKIFKDRWFLGGGGGAWALLYFSSQSYLYWTTQAHNYFLQVGIESGILGILVLVFLLICLIYTFIIRLRNKSGSGNINVNDNVLQAVLFTSIAALLIHSAIDFDLSLSSVSLLLWELIALYNVKYREQAATGTKPLFGKFRKLNINPVLGLVAVLIIIVIPIMFLSALVNAQKALEANKADNLNEAVRYMEKAKSIDPIAPEYKIDYANFLVAGKGINEKNIAGTNKLIAHAEYLARYNANLTDKIGSYYLATGNIEKGLNMFDSTVNLRPFSPKDWKRKIDAYTQVVAFYFTENDVQNALGYIDKTLSIIEEAKNVNKNNMIPFIFETEAMEVLEKLKYIKDLYGHVKQIDINKIAFYSIPGLDVNLDGIPDQWNENIPSDIKLSYGNGNIIVENPIPGEIRFIESRKLFLQPGKEYRVEVELAETAGIDEIPFAVTGIGKQNDSLMLEGDRYIAEIFTPGDFKPGENVLKLGVNGKYEIRNVLILEKGVSTKCKEL